MKCCHYDFDSLCRELAMLPKPWRRVKECQRLAGVFRTLFLPAHVGWAGCQLPWRGFYQQRDLWADLIANFNRVCVTSIRWDCCRSLPTGGSRQRDSICFLLLLLPSFQLSFQPLYVIFWGGQTGISRGSYCLQ